jgi:MFS superfamily sulfate permease-like transporter
MQAAHSLLLRHGAEGQPPVRAPTGRIVCLRLSRQLCTATADALVQAVSARVREAGPDTRTVVLDLGQTRTIDDDARGALQRLRGLLAHSQAGLRLVHPTAEVRGTLSIDGPSGAIGPEDVHRSLREALLAAHASLPGPALVTPATRRFLTEPPELLSLP